MKAQPRKIEILSRSAQETKKIAVLLAREVARAPFSFPGALLIGLKGELGGGKTAFAQGFGKGLGVRANIQSPTFVLMKRYILGARKRFRFLVHIDAYRVTKPRQLIALGWKELVSDTRTVILVEWADRIATILPKVHITILFTLFNETTRLITVERKG